MNTLNKLCGFARVQFWSGSGPTLYKIRFHSKPLVVTVEALKRRSVDACSLPVHPIAVRRWGRLQNSVLRSGKE